jgi:hypothetical protein
MMLDYVHIDLAIAIYRHIWGAEKSYSSNEAVESSADTDSSLLDKADW